MPLSFEINKVSPINCTRGNLKWFVLIIEYITFSWYKIMPTAYILANCTLGSEERIIKEIAELPEVKEVSGTYGVYDIFVKVKSDTIE